MNKKQHGFSAIEGLLVLVIVGLIGFVGWYVWNTKNNVNKSQQNSVASENSAIKKSQPTSTQGQTGINTTNWTKVTSAGPATGKFSIRIPDGWKVQNWQTANNVSAESYSDTTYSLGTPATTDNGDGIARDSGPPPRFSVDGYAVDINSTLGSSAQDFGPISGVMGKKYVHTYSQSDLDNSPGGGWDLKVGDKVYSYMFQNSKAQISVNYYVLNGEKDQSALVEQAIKTLSFE